MPTEKTPGQIAYEAYVANTKTRGLFSDISKWVELAVEIQKIWEAIAKAVADAQKGK